MGEDKKQAPGKDAGGGGEKKKDAAGGDIVLKVDLHCAGCAGKVRKAIKHAPGVESVAADMAAGKVVVTGPADAAELKDRIETKTKKPVQIVSAGAGPPPKKDKQHDKEKKPDGDKKGAADKEKGGGGDKKGADKEKGGGGDNKKAAASADKPKKEEKKSKEPKEETVTLKIRLHCDGCIDRIKRRISKIKGVKNVVIDAGKDLVKVTGTMDAAALPAYLRDKLSRPVEVVASAGKKDGDNKDNKGGDKKKDGGDGEKKDKSAAAAAAAAAASVAPAPLADAGMYQMPPHYGGYMPYPPPPSAGGYYGPPPPANPAAFYHGHHQYPPPTSSYPYAAAHVHAPQMFSDENPNACSVM